MNEYPRKINPCCIEDPLEARADRKMNERELIRELVNSIKAIRRAFYIDGKKTALQAAIEPTKDLMKRAEETVS